MRLKQGFWWGKLSGLLVGSVSGASGMALAIFLDAVLNGRIRSGADWFWEMIVYGFAGLFVGAVFGAILGTLLGVLIAWTSLEDFAPAIWTFFWAIVGLLTSLLPFELRILLSPVVWVWLGGVVGWYGGNFFLRGVRSPDRAAADDAQVESA